MSLEALKVNPQFQQYQRLLKKRFDEKYSFMRSVKTIEGLREIEGYLQALEYALALIDFEETTEP